MKPPPAPADPLSARRAALRVLLACRPGQLRFTAAFERELERRPLVGKERALAHTLAAGTLKLRRKLDFLIDRFLETRHRPLPVPIAEILRMGAFQLTELERIPRHAAVSTSVDLAKQWGHAGTARLCNAVLRRVAEASDWSWPPREADLVMHLGTLYSYPNWMVRRWVADFGQEEAAALCRTGNLPAGTSLRLTADPQRRAAVSESLRAHLPHVAAGRWFPEFVHLGPAAALHDLPALPAGDATVQNEAAAIAVHLLQPEPGEQIAEIGAAPGGKSTQAAERVGPAGRVVAIDRSRRRMRRLVENVRRLEASTILPVIADGRQLPLRNARKILLDAPCSALGLVHRHPDLRWQRDIADVARLADLQLELLRSAVDALTPGGRVVYSTCTLTKEENEGVVARLLEVRPGVTVLDPRPMLPPGVPATSEWVRLHPDPPQLDGAFACCLLKTA